MSMKRISVVIPTQGRLPALSRTLAALADQELGGLEAELVIVCSGRAPADCQEVRVLAASQPLPAKVVARRDGGAAGARNAGVGVAESELILFLNDDTPPLSRDLVREHAEMHAAGEIWRGVLGRVVWHPDAEETPVMAWLASSGKMNDYTELQAGDGTGSVLYAPNLSVHRAALLEVGGFDERFWRYGWEEYDLALRLADRGFEVVFAPGLLVGHDHVYSLPESLRRMESMGRGANLFNRIHRERGELMTPAPAGIKAAVARLVAPLARFVPVPAWMPARAREASFRILHYAMLARGYASRPIPEGTGRAGAIPGQVEPVS